MPGDVKPPPPLEADDELDELPPMDGDGDDAEEGSDGEDLDEGMDVEGGTDLDDSTAEGDSALDEDIDTTGAESGWLDDAAESDALDVGVPETFGEEEGATLLEGAEELEAEEEDLGFGEGEAPIGDVGEEGFEKDEEEVSEADLPPLDQDGTGEDGATDEPDLDPLDDVGSGADEPRPVWADRAWERAGGDVGGLAAVEVLALGERGVLVGGQGLAAIDPNGGVSVLEALGLRGGAPRAFASEGTRLAVATPRAGLLVSDNGGASFAESNGWRALADDTVKSVVVLAGELWVLLAGGALVRSADGGATWTRVDGKIDAITVDRVAGSVVAFARGDATSSIGVEAKGGQVEPFRRAPVVGGGSGAQALLAAQGGRLAVGFPAYGAFVSAGPTEPWVRVEGTASMTALAFGPEGTLLVALHSEAEAKSWVALAYAGMETEPRTVAEIDPARPGEMIDDGDSARVRDLAWSNDLRTLWAAGGFGVVALRPSKR